MEKVFWINIGGKMSRLKRDSDLSEKSQEIIDVATGKDFDFINTIAKSIRFDKVVSTGSTLLDLAISGNRVYGGGIPGGIVVEIFGPSGHGKTLLSVEICSSAEFRGGEAIFDDPEGRLDKEYARLTNNLDLSQKHKYRRSKTVEDAFDAIEEWCEEEGTGNIDATALDSLAALSTRMEMDSEDKRGQDRAKQFSTRLRKDALLLSEKTKLLICTNQVRQGEGMGGRPKEITPGGEAFKFYASLRMRIGPSLQGFKIKDKIKLDSGKEVEKVIGIYPVVSIVKNSCDDPYREASVPIIFGRGIDDIRSNLQWYKDMKKESSYNCIDKNVRSMEKAIEYIEENNLQLELRKQIINLWMEIEQLFKKDRKPKVRF